MNRVTRAISATVQIGVVDFHIVGGLLFSKYSVSSRSINLDIAQGGLKVA